MIPVRQPEGPYLSFVSDASGRHATLEDDGYSAWLYLTSQSKHEVIATAFVYSRVELPGFRVAPFGRSRPPLLLRKFATPVAVQRSVAEESLRIEFSADGNSAVVLLCGEPWAFVICGQKYGYSKSLSTAGPFGFPWDEQLYREHFQNIHSG